MDKVFTRAAIESAFASGYLNGASDIELEVIPIDSLEIRLKMARMEAKEYADDVMRPVQSEGVE